MTDISASTPLPGTTTGALRGLREALTRNGFRIPRKGGDVSMAIRELAMQAREAGVPVEQLIILVKREWQAIGAAGGSTQRADGLAVTERLVALCLDEFFADE